MGGPVGEFKGWVQWGVHWVSPKGGYSGGGGPHWAGAKEGYSGGGGGFIRRVQREDTGGVHLR